MNRKRFTEYIPLGLGEDAGCVGELSYIGELIFCQFYF